MSKKEIYVSRLLSGSRRNIENYKALSANLAFAGGQEKVILITSSIPGEGKSHVSFNLAFTLAGNGKRVLLMDCDLRRSQYARKLKVSGADVEGVSEILNGKKILQNCIHPTEINNLELLLCGKYPENPAELLLSGRFAEMIEECKEQYDYVIIDTAPIASVIDAAILCRYSDGVLFVIGSDMVSCRLAQKSVRQLERAGGKILGCTLNKMKMSNRALYGTYGTNKYYYGTYQDAYVSDGDEE